MKKSLKPSLFIHWALLFRYFKTNLRSFIQKSLARFVYFHVCVLLCSAAAVCHHDLPSFSVLLNTNHTGFCFSVYMCFVVLCGCCVPP